MIRNAMLVAVLLTSLSVPVMASVPWQYGVMTFTEVRSSSCPVFYK